MISWHGEAKPYYQAAQEESALAASTYDGCFRPIITGAATPRLDVADQGPQVRKAQIRKAYSFQARANRLITGPHTSI